MLASIYIINVITDHIINVCSNDVGCKKVYRLVEKCIIYRSRIHNQIS